MCFSLLEISAANLDKSSFEVTSQGPILFPLFQGSVRGLTDLSGCRLVVGETVVGAYVRNYLSTI